MTQDAALRPNILVVHWHDLGTHLSPYGVAVESPAAQRLADEGLVFDNWFAPTPLCSPARGALWTGRYPHSNGLQGLTHRGWEYHDGERTLPMLLGDLGYHSCLIGLQHEAADARRTGFAEIDELTPAHSGTVADKAIDWLAGHRDDEAPWLLTCGMTEVHRPWPHHRYRPADPARVDVPAPLPDNELTRQDIADYEGAITLADRDLGRILAALDALGLAASTLVVFVTDHGSPFPYAKSTLYDAGVRVTMLLRPPAAWQVAPRRIEDLASHVDLVPTLLGLLGAEIPAGIQGVDLSDTIRGEASGLREEVFLEKTYHGEYDPIRAIRTRTHKYVINFESRPLLQLPTDLEASLTRQGMGDDHLAERPAYELYDLVTDPAEQHNLVDDPDQVAVRDDLARRLDDFLRETGDPVLAGPIPDPQVE